MGQGLIRANWEIRKLGERRETRCIYCRVAKACTSFRWATSSWLSHSLGDRDETIVACKLKGRKAGWRARESTRGKANIEFEEGAERYCEDTRGSARV